MRAPWKDPHIRFFSKAFFAQVTKGDWIRKFVVNEFNGISPSLTFELSIESAALNVLQTFSARR